MVARAGERDWERVKYKHKWLIISRVLANCISPQHFQALNSMGTSFESEMRSFADQQQAIGEARANARAASQQAKELAVLVETHLNSRFPASLNADLVKLIYEKTSCERLQATLLYLADPQPTWEEAMHRLDLHHRHTQAAAEMKQAEDELPSENNSVTTFADRMRAEVRAEVRAKLDEARARLRAELDKAMASEPLTRAIREVADAQLINSIILTSNIFGVLQHKYLFDEARLNAARKGLANTKVERLDEVLTVLIANLGNTSNFSNKELDALLGITQGGNGHG